LKGVEVRSTRSVRKVFERTRVDKLRRYITFVTRVEGKHRGRAKEDSNKELQTQVSEDKQALRRNT
jgi:hypothetical protein